MKFIFSLLVLGLVSASNASPLSDIAQILATSNTVNEFILRASPKSKITQEELTNYAKVYQVDTLPKSTFENNVLTMINPDGTKMSLAVKNGRAGEFLVNGKMLKVEWQDNVFSLAKKVEALVVKKTSLLRSWLLPEANAFWWVAGIAAVGALAYLATEYLPVDTCEGLVKAFQKKLKSMAGSDKENPGRMIQLRKFNSCNAELANFEVLDYIPNKSSRLLKVEYKREIGSQAGEVKTETIDAADKEVTVYDFFKGNTGLDSKLTNLKKNDAPMKINEPSQKNLAIYADSSVALINGLGKNCNECRIDELNNFLLEPSAKREKPGKPGGAQQ